MLDDLLERSFQAATAKYKRMHGLAADTSQLAEADSPTREDAERTLQSQSADDGFVQRQNGTAAFDYQATSRITYSKDELTDIAELNPISASTQDVLPNLLELHLEREPQPAEQQEAALQHNGSMASQPLPPMPTFTSMPQASMPQQHSSKPGQQPMDSTSMQSQQADHRQLPARQQYSEADWAAYWQYYGYSAPPPTPPPAPQLCPTHMQLLQQMLTAITGQPDPVPVVAQQAVPESVIADKPAPSASQSTRSVLESRADKVQGGSLTELLMAWFDAGYQTGRHEALSQNI